MGHLWKVMFTYLENILDFEVLKIHVRHYHYVQNKAKYSTHRLPRNYLGDYSELATNPCDLWRESWTSRIWHTLCASEIPHLRQGWDESRKPLPVCFNSRINIHITVLPLWKYFRTSDFRSHLLRSGRVVNPRLPWRDLSSFFMRFQRRCVTLWNADLRPVHFPWV